MRQYITSDLHFFHKKIALYCDRPYDLNDPDMLSKMNEDLLKHFDKLPDENDVVVWNLGDVFFGKDLDKVGVDGLKEIVSRMKGKNRKLHLVLGNHDKQILRMRRSFKAKSLVAFFESIGFDKVYDIPVVVDNEVILSHEPVYLSKGSNFKNIYGHTHNTTVDSQYFTKDLENWAMEARAYRKNGLEPPEPKIVWPEKEIDVSMYYNVCIDYHNKILRLENVKHSIFDREYEGQI